MPVRFTRLVPALMVAAASNVQLPVQVNVRVFMPMVPEYPPGMAQPAQVILPEKVQSITLVASKVSTSVAARAPSDQLPTVFPFVSPADNQVLVAIKTPFYIAAVGFGDSVAQKVRTHRISLAGSTGRSLNL